MALRLASFKLLFIQFNEISFRFRTNATSTSENML